MLIGIALLAPTAAHAAVVISEVAWMGTSVSANAEWIELQNTGSENVSLAGWVLTSATGAPNIGLTGSIAGGGYYLLERTSDASVPSVTADQ
ncbi:MAG: lamin tail domain-containing protein, partial [Patescibacteria group bacterium]